MNAHEQRKETVIRQLNSNADIGLNDGQVAERLDTYGKNKLEDKKKAPLIARFFAQMNDFMIIVLLAAAAISLFISHIHGDNDYIDAVIILAIVTLNAVLGLVQESKAEKALEALKKLSAPSAKALRNGTVSVLDAELIVPGDIILLEAGCYVPADARLITSHNLMAEESALTGESVPTEKDADTVVPETSALGDRKNIVFSGTSISYGRATAVVTGTGMRTEVGKIAAGIMQSETPDTPLQKKLAHTGKILGIIALCICGIIFVAGVLRSIPPFDMFMTSVSLAVAAIPEGLPAIVTVMLAIGVQKMAGHNAVIRKLPAVETLGQATVICSDKTGTLTQNKMTVERVTDGFKTLESNNEHRREILKFAALCTDCVQDKDAYIGDPTEIALVKAAEASGLNKSRLEIDYVRVSELPFESKRKLMSVTLKNGTEFITVTKGAPDVLLGRCTLYSALGRENPLNEEARRRISAANALMAQDALRVIAVAYRRFESFSGGMTSEKSETELVFLGLVGMEDPPRDEAFEAVRVCKEAGIKPVMITGDHVLTATATAKKLGILSAGDKALTGDELSKMSEQELFDRIYDYSVFARVSPENKLQIVRAFQKHGETVAMTGDGVNDAPALKAADIGCAMGISGTDTAKAAADIILTDDNFATIVSAIEEGRGIYENIKKSVHFLLSSNIGEIITIFAAILLGWKSPLTAIQLLWVNLVTDSLPAIALGLDPNSHDIMRKKPYSAEKSLFSGGLWQKIFFEGGMIGMLALIGFGIGTIFFDAPGRHFVGSTMAFATLSISQLVHAFNMRSEGSIFNLNPLGNIYLVGALIAGIILQISVITIKPLAAVFKVSSLEPKEWLVVAFLCIMPIIIVEIEKALSSGKEEKAAGGIRLKKRA